MPFKSNPGVQGSIIWMWTMRYYRSPEWVTYLITACKWIRAVKRNLVIIFIPYLPCVMYVWSERTTDHDESSHRGGHGNLHSFISHVEPKPSRFQGASHCWQLSPILNGLLAGILAPLVTAHLILLYAPFSGFSAKLYRPTVQPRNGTYGPYCVAFSHCTHNIHYVLLILAMALWWFSDCVCFDPCILSWVHSRPS